MTRKDFVLIAETIAALQVSESDRDHIAARFAESLRSTNANFKRETFISACKGPR